jgi:hypothetical protein
MKRESKNTQKYETPVVMELGVMAQSESNECSLGVGINVACYSGEVALGGCNEGLAAVGLCVVGSGP